MASGSTYKEAWFVSSNDLDNISILLHEDNIYLFNEVRIFIFKSEKNNQSDFKYTQKMYRNTSNYFKYVF